MAVMGTWVATSVIDRSVSVVRAYAQHGGREHEGDVTAVLDQETYDAARVVLAKDTVWGSIDIDTWILVLPRPQEDGAFRTTVVFVDSFGNKYRQKATFPFVGS
jgi:hypothetical protein